MPTMGGISPQKSSIAGRPKKSITAKPLGLGRFAKTLGVENAPLVKQTPAVQEQMIKHLMSSSLSSSSLISAPLNS